MLKFDGKLPLYTAGVALVAVGISWGSMSQTLSAVKEAQAQEKVKLDKAVERLQEFKETLIRIDERGHRLELKIDQTLKRPRND